MDVTTTLLYTVSFSYNDGRFRRSSFVKVLADNILEAYRKVERLHKDKKELSIWSVNHQGEVTLIDSPAHDWSIYNRGGNSLHEATGDKD